MLIIGIAGGTGSGKTTVVRKIIESLPVGEVVLLPQDSYYKDSSHVPVEERQNINFDHPDAFEWSLLSKHVMMLKEGKSIEQPTYSYLTCTRQPETIHIEPREVVIIEGILALCDKKLRNTDVGRLVSYIEMEFQGPQNTPKLQQAFVQFKGFTLGQAWSTFGDMTAVPTTIDEEGPSSGIEIRQPMLRYTYHINDRWQSSLALEYAKASYTTGKNAESIRQKVPDIPLNIRYTMKNGSHVQVGAILRNIGYKNVVKDKDKIRTGWGVMGSGKLNITSSTSFLFQAEYGKGIANYIQDISGIGYDLIPTADDNGNLKAPGMWGLFGAFQHNWNPKLYSTITYSYARLEARGSLEGDTYKYAQYAGANLLWNFTEFGTTGIEYVFGRRNNFNHDYGNASRINAMIQYRF